ncbi:MAG: FkbM family methyltransferase [Woeseiaceae bacterium]|nr:FkbM family methyltransferase [Woeseiaceae bacterium]
MRTSGWMKRQPWFWPIKLFLKRIAGKELWLKPEVSCSVRISDGWKYSADGLGESAVVYSLGVGDCIDFDLDLIERHGVTVHTFDPTPYAHEWIGRQDLPGGLEFHPWAAAGEDGTLRLFRRVNQRGKRSVVMWTADDNAGDTDDYIDAPAHTIATMMDKLGHETVDLLKIDVEGAEFDIIDGLKACDRLPKQLLVEYHHRFPGIGKRRTAESIARLRELGYRIFAVAETGREVSFVLR